MGGSQSNAKTNQMKIDATNYENNPEKCTNITQSTLCASAEIEYGKIKSNKTNEIYISKEKDELIINNLNKSKKLLESIKRINDGIDMFGVYIFCVKENTIDTKDISYRNNNNDNHILNFINGLYSSMGYKTNLNNAKIRECSDIAQKLKKTGIYS